MLRTDAVVYRHAVAIHDGSSHLNVLRLFHLRALQTHPPAALRHAPRRSPSPGAQHLEVLGVELLRTRRAACIFTRLLRAIVTLFKFDMRLDMAIRIYCVVIMSIGREEIHIAVRVRI